MKNALPFILVAALAVSAGCGNELDPAPAKLTVTQSIFTPVYRAAKSIQGATGPGVTYMKFGELLQEWSTEIAIAKDQQMNDIDKRLLAKYEEAIAAYKFSADLWKQKNEAHQDYWNGEIPVGFSGTISPEFADGLQKFKLTPVNRKMPYTGASFSAIPGDSIQQVWLFASAAVDEATEIYYGRSDGTTPAKSK